MPENYEEIRNQIIAKAWKDPSFKKKLISNPKEALKEFGVSMPENITVKAVEDAPNALTFVIPSPPKNVGELSEQELVKMAGGTGKGFMSAFAGPFCLLG